MINREQLRLTKQQECKERIEQMYEVIPRLREIDQAISKNSLNLIRRRVMEKARAESTAGLEKEIETLLRERLEVLAASGLTEEVYRPQWSCTRCEDRGYIKPGVPCQCYLQERLDEQFAQSGIPQAMREYSFDNFDVQYYTDPVNMQQKLERCRSFVERLRQGQQKSNMVFFGDVGRGKTHLSIAIANGAMANGNTVIYKRMDDLLDLIRNYKYDNSIDDQQAKEALNQLRQCDLLIIDDLGAEKITDFGSNQLRLIIEDRNLADKPWIINSNLAAGDMSEAYGARTFDRIQEKAVFFKFESSTSIRLIKREQHL